MSCSPGGDAQHGLSALWTKTTGLVLSCAVCHTDRDFRGRLCWEQGPGCPPQTQKGSSQCLGDTSTTWGLAICRAHEDKDGCFRNAVECIHPEELGGNVCFILSDISSTSIHTPPKAISLQEFVSHPSFFAGFAFLSVFSEVPGKISLEFSNKLELL